MTVKIFRSRINNSIASNKRNTDGVARFNSETKTGRFLATPERIQSSKGIKEQVIVELYSK